MFLNPSQIEELKNVFSAQGLNCNEFKFNNDELGFSYYKITDSRSYRFRICKTIQGALFGDIYCEPYTYMPHIYMSCDNFEDCLNYALEWATVTKYKLAGKTYYHKIFISHSSEDKILIDEFVDKVLRLSCGFKTSEIIYTSQQTTGVKLGENIPQFIKENIANSSIIFFMISPNYRKSEVCLNEMGAAWALEKKWFQSYYLTLHLIV